jgi:formamidopyrimidine-DNA glycosylase
MGWLTLLAPPLRPPPVVARGVWKKTREKRSRVGTSRPIVRPPEAAGYGRRVPELPEVEVTRRRLLPLLVGRRIRSVRTSAASYLFLTPPARLRRRLRGRRFEALARRGKYLLGELEGGERLVIHLGMTGQLFSSAAASPRLLSASARAALAPEDQPGFRPDAHTHLRLAFEDGGPEVFLRDVRKFGKLLLLGPGQSHPRLERLGEDALALGGAALFRAARGRRAAIKSLLLDQSIVAGVGNIYADEALFLAGVRPTRRAARVTRAECDALALSLRRVLERSIETGGSSISDFVAPDGSDGGYQSERRVYARGGEPCAVCGSAISRTLVGQRGTHYCRTCQR